MDIAFTLPDDIALCVAQQKGYQPQVPVFNPDGSQTKVDNPQTAGDYLVSFYFQDARNCYENKMAQDAAQKASEDARKQAQADFPANV